MAEVFDLKAMVTADVSPFNKAMDSSADSVSGSLKAIHAAANAFIGSGFIRTFAKATKTAYEFGQVMADISSISDVSIKNLSRSIAKMENVYGKMSTIGDSIYETISSGIRGTEKEYIDFTKVVGQTAKSIRADLKDTSNVITTLTNAYGLGISDVQKLSDMLFVTVREGKAHGNELAHTLGLVTNTAAEAGVSLAEMSAVISILSRTQSASQSMIGFNQMLNALIKPTQEATREAKKWGIELGATALQAKGLTAILTEMHEKVGGNVEAINAMLGNIRAMRAGTALTGKQFNNFIEVLRTAEREIGSGVAFKAFEKQTATAQQALKNLETQVDKTFTGIGKDFEPVTKPFIEAVESYLRAFDDSSSIRRWNTYLSIALMTFKAIKSTIHNIRDTINSLSGVGGMGAGSAIGLKQQLARQELYAGKDAIRERNAALASSKAEAMAMYKEGRDEVSETIRQLKANLNENRRITNEIITIERNKISDIKKVYNEELTVRKKAISDLKAQEAKSVSELNSARAARANLDIAAYTGSAAILSRNIPTNVASGNRTFDKQQLAQARYDASMQYLQMATEADIDAVLQKNLNPLKGELHDIAKSNIERMYNIKRDAEGNVVYVRDPSTLQEVDYEKVLARETARVSAGYRSARTQHSFVVEAQRRGKAKYLDDKSALDTTIVDKTEEINKLRSQLEKEIQAQDKAKETAMAGIEKSKAIIEHSRTQLREISDATSAEATRLRDNIARTQSELKRYLTLLEQSEATNEQRAAMQDKINKKEQELAALERRQLRLSIRKLSSAQRLREGLTAFDADTVRSRYRRRYDNFNLHPVNWMSNRISGVTTAVSTSPITKAISAVAGKLAAIPMVISTAVEAFQFGKELGEKFKIADSRFAKWLSTLELPFAGRAAKSEEELHKQEIQNVETLRKIANNRLKTAVLSGDINESTAYLHARQIALANTYKEVQDALTALKKDLPKPKEDTPENGRQGASDAPKRKEGTMAEIQARSKLIESSMVQLHEFNKSADFAGFSKISDDELRSLVDAISQEDLDSRVKQIKDKLSNIRSHGEGLNSIEGARMVGYAYNVGIFLDSLVTGLSKQPKDIKGRKRRKEIEDSAAAGADVKNQMTDLYDAFTGAHSTFSEESTEAYRKRIMGTDTYTQGEYAFQMLKDAEKHLKTQEKALSTYMSEGSDLLTDYANNPLNDTEADANAKLTYRNNAELAYNRIVEVREAFRTRVDEVIKQSEKDVDGIIDTLKLEGVQEGSFAYANTFSTNVRKEIDRLDKAISQTSDEYASKRLKLLRLKYVDMEKEAFNKAKENLKKTQEGQSDMVKGSFGVIKNVLASMSVTNKDRNATMTNDQLYHSVSMLSKVVGPSIVKRQSSIYARDPYGARDTRARARTEQQVLAGLDAYIMSQRQKEANVGKTVFDIYTFMKNNKQIVVGNK